MDYSAKATKTKPKGKVPNSEVSMRFSKESGLNRLVVARTLARRYATFRCGQLGVGTTRCHQLGVGTFRCQLIQPRYFIIESSLHSKFIF